jgi:hypothetical protein
MPPFLSFLPAELAALSSQNGGRKEQQSTIVNTKHNRKTPTEKKNFSPIT